MLCSHCGFENPSGHRFCGMCGTPLPHRPLTAPGAESTAGLTRLPVEVSQPASAEATGPNYFSQAEQAQSLEQFIAGFHYTPPADEDEVTMTGAKPTLDSAAKYEPETPISLSEEPSVAEAEPPAKVGEQVPASEVAPPAESIVEQPPHVATEPPPFATKGMKDQAPDRSRFLGDLSEPAKEAPPATCRTKHRRTRRSSD